MTTPERWFTYAVIVGALILTERRIIDHALMLAEKRYWERRR